MGITSLGLLCTKRVHTMLYTYVVLTLVLYELFHGLSPLIKDFLWKLIDLNISNYILEFERYNIKIVYLIILNFWNYSPFVLIVTYSLWVLIYPINLLLTNTLVRPILWFHFSLFIFIWVSLVTTSYTNTRWDLTTLSVYQSTKTHQISLNSFFIDHLFLNYKSCDIYTSWNILLSDTTLEVYSFTYFLYTNINYQSILLGSQLFKFSITVIEILSNNIISILSVLFFIYINIYLSKLKIIF